MCDSMLFAGFSTRCSRAENGEYGYDLPVWIAFETHACLLKSLHLLTKTQTYH